MATAKRRLIKTSLPVVFLFEIAAVLAFSFWLLPRVIRFFGKVFQSVRGFFRPARTEL